MGTCLDVFLVVDPFKHSLTTFLEAAGLCFEIFDCRSSFPDKESLLTSFFF